jgi:hypothetical protein
MLETGKGRKVEKSYIWNMQADSSLLPPKACEVTLQEISPTLLLF